MMFNNLLTPRVGVLHQPLEILDRPQCAANDTQFLVSCLDTSGRIVLFSIDSYQGTYTTATSSVIARSTPAVAVFRDMTALAFDRDDDTISLALTPTLTAPLNPVVLPFATFSPVALAQAQDRLLLLWQEPEVWSLHLAVSTDGITFTDHDLGLHASRYALFADDTTAGNVVLAWSGRTPFGNKVYLGLLDPTAPDKGLVRQLEIDAGPTEHVSVGSTSWHGTDHIVVTYTVITGDQGQQTGRRAVARRVKPNLASETLLGPEEGLVGSTYGVSIARAALRTWITWRDYLAGQLHAMPFELAFGLPPEYQKLLDQECDEKACMVDPRLICSPTNEIRPTLEAARIATGQKGDLVVTPADGVGFIGSFLGVLKFPQLYDHMGILIEDEYVVRHCTMGHERAKDKAYYRGSFSIAGVEIVPAPTEGFEPNVMRYGWPGTITQTVQDAFFDGFDNADVQMAANRDPKRKQYVDPATASQPDDKKKTYNIHNMTGSLQLRPNGDLVGPLLLRPNSAVESNDPGIRADLYRVVEAAKLIQGHYRFYSYTDAKIAEDSLFQPTNLTGDRDSWANGSLPLVCSSFVWEAVRHANLTGDRPLLLLEGVPETSPEETYRALTEPDSDGLYRYHPDERLTAANTLHDHLVDEVKRDVWNEIVALSGPVGTAQEIGLVVSLGLELLVGPTAMGVAAIVALLGVRVETVQAIVDLLTNVPERVANQMCMTFAKDQPEQIDSTDWKSPGPGAAVAPDDCVRLWDPAQVVDLNARMRIGLWGEAIRLPLVPRALVNRAVHRYKRGKGLARVIGKVTFEGTPVAGATVHLACERLRTDRQGTYSALVSAGPQEVWAESVWKPAGFLLQSKRIAFSASPQPADTVQDIDLQPPPETRRLLVITQNNVDFVHNVLVGHDAWMHDHWNVGDMEKIFEQRFADDPRGSYFDQPTDPSKPDPAIEKDDWWVSDFAAHNRVRVHFQAHLLTDTADPQYLGIKIDVRYEYLEDFLVDKDNPVDRPAGDALKVSDGVSVVVPRDGGQSISIDLKTGGVKPDEAWLKLAFENRVFPF